ncbi:MAG: hypothetical protein VKJ64_16975 [Leptolyngbyaceae bacterium]|nr:hypothetical protein [Leptolyngbyaceae bacterium]
MSVWRVYYHRVWATCDRAPLTTDRLSPELYCYIQITVIIGFGNLFTPCRYEIMKMC